MKKPRLTAIEYIRGISMLGVIGIHVGSQYLSNTMANIHLVALFEIASRFSVPIFFFISAFGLFYNLDMKATFNYKSFMQRRFKTVLIPYLAWSVFYVLQYTILYKDTSLLSLSLFARFLFFGLACYQLYFLVILLWFYILMPLWIWLVKHMTSSRLLILLILQIAFDYYSSFVMNPYGIENAVIKELLVYRLNYWVLHYLFIFILGGYLAVHINAFQSFMKSHRIAICFFFWLSMLTLLGYYYKLLFYTGYTPIEAINTAHQLSPAGIFYTIAASIFFFTIFTFNNYPKGCHTLLGILGHHSYFAYLAHPVAITYLSMFLTSQGILMTAPVAILFYIAVVFLSIIAGSIVRRIGGYLPMINILSIGVYPKSKNS